MSLWQNTSKPKRILPTIYNTGSLILNSPTENLKNALIHAKELLDKDNLNKNSYPVYANLDEPVKKSNEIENQTIIDMMNLFSGRENTHSRQWHDDSGKMGYVPVKELFHSIP
jgi:hypothetical protein